MGLCKKMVAGTGPPILVKVGETSFPDILASVSYQIEYKVNGREYTLTKQKL